MLREEGTHSFKWEVDDFGSHVDSTIASPYFVSEEKVRWRGVWKKTLFLQLQSAVNPVTVKIRWVE